MGQQILVLIYLPYNFMTPQEQSYQAGQLVSIQLGVLVYLLQEPTMLVSLQRLAGLSEARVVNMH